MLYRGFGLLDHPQAAAHAFDRAIELGGDLVEALRGKLLAAIGAVEEAMEESREHRRLLRALAGAADRLARALDHEAWGGALVAAAEEIAAKAWVDAGDAPAANASIARARAAVGNSAALDRIEIEVLALRDPTAAQARIEALLSRDRADVEAWRLKIELSRTAEDAEAALREAAAATGDPELVEAAESAGAELALDEDLEELLNEALAQLERGPAAFAHLPPHERSAIQREILEIISKPPTPRSVSRLMSILEAAAEGSRRRPARRAPAAHSAPGGAR
jgi:hypothetical protein